MPGHVDQVKQGLGVATSVDILEQGWASDGGLGLQVAPVEDHGLGPFPPYMSQVALAQTGRPYQEVMRAITLDPLGLKDTDASAATAASPKLAVGYASATPPARRRNDRVPYMAAAGGYFSTASDLLKAAHQIFDTGFLSPASQASLRTVEVASDSYALGGRIRTLWIDGKPYPAGWETGNTAGYRSVLGHRFDTRTSVVILNNTSLSQKALDLFADKLFGAVTPA